MRNAEREFQNAFYRNPLCWDACIKTRGGTLSALFITFKVMDYFRPGIVTVRDAALILKMTIFVVLQKFIPKI